MTLLFSVCTIILGFSNLLGEVLTKLHPPNCENPLEIERITQLKLGMSVAPTEALLILVSVY